MVIFTAYIWQPCLANFISLQVCIPQALYAYEPDVCKCIHHSDQWSYSDIKVSSDTHKWRAFRIFYLLFYNYKQIEIIMIQRTIVINTIKYINDQPSCCFFMCIRFKPINFFSQLRAILDFAMTVTPLTKISHRSLCFRSFCGDLRKWWVHH
jgi:hypothetical protein